MVNAKRDYTFELFGYDFLVDEDLRVWLIEVNYFLSLPLSLKINAIF
jgi:hypothetical protein